MSSPRRHETLREKARLFSIWGLDGEEEKMLDEGDEAAAHGRMQPESCFSAEEKEHRRRSRAFALAAVAATGVEEPSPMPPTETAQRTRPGIARGCQDSAAVENIDLRRPFPPAPRLTVSTTESMCAPTTKVAAAVVLAGLQRTTSHQPRLEIYGDDMPTPESKRRKRWSTGGGDDVVTATSGDASPPQLHNVLFSGLTFYYLPDTALGARRLRIAKAQQHGARWVRILRNATHVIVDKQLRWAEVALAVRGRRPGTVLVNDEYPLDCIGFRYLLKPDQPRYRIAGWPGDDNVVDMTGAPKEADVLETEKEDAQPMTNVGASTHASAIPPRWLRP